MSATDRRSRRAPEAARSSWDRVATWYDGWVGPDGSRYHRVLAIPAALELLEVAPGERILDLGSGQGVLAPHISRLRARYTGVELSPRLVELARRRHGREGHFLAGDARRLETVVGLAPASFDAAVFLLSAQDIDPIEAALRSAAWALARSSRIVLVMTHPAFRQPRHSGWGTDAARGLTYRRIDAYLTPMAVPMKQLGAAPATRSFHRPISTYVNALAGVGFAVDAMREIGDLDPADRPARRPGHGRADSEIPLFLSLRARRS